MQTVTAQERVRTVESLYAFSRKLAGAGTLDDVLWATAYQIASMLKVRVVLLLPEDGVDRGQGRLPAGGQARGGRSGRGQMGLGEEPPRRPRFGRAARRQMAVPADAHGAWASRHSRHLARKPGPLLRADQRRLLDALSDQGALAIERVHLVEDIERVRRAAETDRLRSALLTSISHDLKTPLAAVLGAAGALRDLSKSSTTTPRPTCSPPSSRSRSA